MPAQTPSGRVLEGAELAEYARKNGLCHICALYQTHMVKGFFQYKRTPMSVKNDQGEYTVYKGYCIQNTCYTLDQAKEALGETTGKQTFQIGKRARKINEDIDKKDKKPSILISKIDSKVPADIPRTVFVQDGPNGNNDGYRNISNNNITHSSSNNIHKNNNDNCDSDNNDNQTEEDDRKIHDVHSIVLKENNFETKYLTNAIQESLSALGELCIPTLLLEELDLDSLGLGDQCALLLQSALETTETLMVLRLARNHISSEGADRIARGIQSNNNSVLCMLDLSFNPVGDQGAESLGFLLLSSHTVQQLWLQATGVSDLGAYAIATAIQHNEQTALRELNLQDNRIGPSGAMALGCLIATNHTIETLILKKNSIQFDGLMELYHALEGNPNSALKYLKIGSNAIGKFPEVLASLGALWCRIGLGESIVSERSNFRSRVVSRSMFGSRVALECEISKCTAELENGSAEGSLRARSKLSILLPFRPTLLSKNELELRIDEINKRLLNEQNKMTAVMRFQYKMEKILCEIRLSNEITKENDIRKSQMHAINLTLTDSNHRIDSITSSLGNSSAGTSYNNNNNNNGPVLPLLRSYSSMVQSQLNKIDETNQSPELVERNQAAIAKLAFLSDECIYKTRNEFVDLVRRQLITPTETYLKAMQQLPNVALANNSGNYQNNYNNHPPTYNNISPIPIQRKTSDSSTASGALRYSLPEKTNNIGLGNAAATSMKYSDSTFNGNSPNISQRKNIELRRSLTAESDNPVTTLPVNWNKGVYVHESPVTLLRKTSNSSTASGALRRSLPEEKDNSCTGVPAAAAAATPMESNGDEYNIYPSADITPRLNANHVVPPPKEFQGNMTTKNENPHHKKVTPARWNNGSNIHNSPALAQRKTFHDSSPKVSGILRRSLPEKENKSGLSTASQMKYDGDTNIRENHYIMEDPSTLQIESQSSLAVESDSTTPGHWNNGSNIHNSRMMLQRQTSNSSIATSKSQRKGLTEEGDDPPTKKKNKNIGNNSTSPTMLQRTAPDTSASSRTPRLGLTEEGDNRDSYKSTSNERGPEPSVGIPGIPDYFSYGREADVDNTLHLLRCTELVRITGPPRMGKSVVAAEVCRRLIHNQQQEATLRFQKVIWLPPRAEFYLEGDELYSTLCKAVELLVCRNSDIWNDSLFLNCWERILMELKFAFILLVIDERCFKTVSSAWNMEVFVSNLIQETNTKVILLASIQDEPVAGSDTICLRPLDFVSTARLFARLSMTVLGRSYPIAKNAQEFVELIAPPSITNAANHLKSDRQLELYKIMGHGVLQDIHFAAKKISQHEFEEFIQLAKQPEVQAQSLKDIDYSERLRKNQLQAAIRDSNFLEAEALHKALVELERRRDYFSRKVNENQKGGSSNNNNNKALQDQSYQKPSSDLDMTKYLDITQRLHERASVVEKKLSLTLPPITSSSPLTSHQTHKNNDNNSNRNTNLTFRFNSKKEQCNVYVCCNSVEKFDHSFWKSGIICWTNEAMIKVSSPPSSSSSLGNRVFEDGGPELEGAIASLPIVAQTQWGPVRCEMGNATRVGPNKFGQIKCQFIILPVGPTMPIATISTASNKQTSTRTNSNNGYHHHHQEVDADSIQFMKCILRAAYRSSFREINAARLEVAAFPLLANRQSRDTYKQTLAIGLNTLLEEVCFSNLRELHILASEPTEIKLIGEIYNDRFKRNNVTTQCINNKR